MSHKLPDIRTINVQNKKVFLRLDLDVPLSEVGSERLEARISDDMRLEAGLPTIELLLKNNAEIIIAGHLGRPEGVNKNLSLKPIAEWFSKKLQTSHFKDPASHFSYRTSRIGGFEAWKFNENLILLENLRFYPEEENPSTGSGEEFSKKLASLSDIYVNDAFGASHRNHASIAGVPKLLPHYAGLRLQKEVSELSKVLDNPNRPLVVVIGGEKIETKLPVVERMLKFADHVLVGGEIATELPSNDSSKPNVLVASLNQEKTDITDESVEKFKEIIQTAKTIVWNGPMGKIIVNSKLQIANSERGTREIANAIVNSSANTIVGGGDTVGFLKREGLLDKFSFASTGGGAMLEFLSGQPLPGLQALQE